MIGGTRIIGGDKETYVKGYNAGLRRALEIIKEDPSKLRQEFLGMKREIYKNKAADSQVKLSSKVSALFDVMTDFGGLETLFGEEIAKKIVEKRINEVLDVYN